VHWATGIAVAWPYNLRDVKGARLMKKEEKRRLLGRKLAKELTSEQLKSVAGGTCSCCSGQADDLDNINY
jgi:hypothetical protein